MAALVKRSLFSGLVFACLVFLSACGSLNNTTQPSPVQSEISIDPTYRDLHQSSGGRDELGPAIDIPRQHDNVTCQYTTNAQLCFNPAARSEADRVYLAPIGLQFNFPTLNPRIPGPIKTYEGFAETIQKKFFGARYVGQPIRSVSYNSELRRIEQYFEKLGFYTLIDDPTHAVHLMPYGLYACGDTCSKPEPPEGAIGWNKSIEILNPGILFRINGFEIFGNPLTVPYLAADGQLEQVFERAVVYAPKENPATLKLRPLAQLLKMAESVPGPQRYGLAENVYFYVVDGGEKGFHVPILFDNLIATHGSKEISGRPLSDPYETILNEERVAGQCFQNYCLEYRPNAPEGQRVQLANLGVEYIRAKKIESVGVFKFTRQSVNLIVSKVKAQVSNQEAQTIQMMLTTQKSQQAVGDVIGFVTLKLPDGSKPSYNFPPTNLTGMSQVTLPPLTNVANGSIIPFIVCIYVPADETICAMDSFFIWNFK